MSQYQMEYQKLRSKTVNIGVAISKSTLIVNDIDIFKLLNSFFHNIPKNTVIKSAYAMSVFGLATSSTVTAMESLM